MAFEIIDFHTHPFNKKSGNFCFYEGSVNSEEEFIFDLEKSGISRFCGSVIDKEKRDFSGVLEGNRIALELSKKYGKKYIPGIHIHPDFVDESEKEIEAAYSEGVRLIGELVPYHHGWKYDHPRLGELMECLDGKDMVISIHSTDSDLAFLEKMAESNPEKTFVFAHPGDIPRVKLIEPLTVDELHNAISRSYMVMTDSGGIQEEAPALGKPVLVLRRETERPEAVTAGTVKLAGVDGDVIYNMAKELLDDKEEYAKMAHAANPYGDGKASERTVEAILYAFGMREDKPENFKAL